MAAFDALRAIARGGVDLPAALAVSRQRLHDDRDRALAAEIVTGTLRWQRSLDHLIAHYARRQPSAVDPEVLCILRLSLYQLLHLDRVPASAAVDEGVELARAARRAHATGFVNAVLRATVRERHRLPLPARPDNTADQEAVLAYLGVTHSHPDWLAVRWVRRYGFDAAERWVRFNNETPRLTLRVNTLRATREDVAAALRAEGVETEATRYAPDGLIVTRGNPLRLPRQGDFVVQDEASQLVALAVDARPDERVLDLCASPGGKTVALAGTMKDRGLLVASDVRPRRMRLLRATVSASGASRIALAQVPAVGSLPFAPVFDRTLVDAPCSGLGTVRRDPDIRWRRHEAELGTLAQGQLELLRRAAATVKPGGRLVYATCSSEPEENEETIHRFLSMSPEFVPIDLRTASAVPAPLVDDRGMMRTLPFEHGLEAFFAAALQRR